MIDGNVAEFIDQLYYQDHYIIYSGKKYFFNGCQCKFDSEGNVASVTLEIYMLEQNVEEPVVFSVTGKTQQYCIDQLLSQPLFDNKTFWEIEKEATWVDC